MQKLNSKMKQKQYTKETFDIEKSAIVNWIKIFREDYAQKLANRMQKFDMSKQNSL